MEKFILQTVEYHKEFSLEMDKTKMWRRDRESIPTQSYQKALELIINSKYIEDNINSLAEDKQIEYLEQLIIANRDQIRQKCGKAIKNDYMVRCSCMKYQSVCFCLECFDETIHQGPEHQYYIFKSSGICDCGQEQACDKQYWCKKHQDKQYQVDQLSQLKQDFINIKQTIGLFVFLTRLQLTYAQLYANDQQYREDYQFIQYILNRILKLNHNVIQSIYSRVILSNFDKLTIEKIYSNFNIQTCYNDIIYVEKYVEEIKKDEDYQLAPRPIHTILVLQNLINDFTMLDYLTDYHVTDRDFVKFIREEYFLYFSINLKLLVQKELYINNENQDMFLTEGQIPLPRTPKLNDQRTNYQNIIIQVLNNKSESLFQDIIGTTIQLIDIYIMQAGLCRQRGNYSNTRISTLYRITSLINDGQAQLFNISRNYSQNQLLGYTIKYIQTNVDLFINIFKQCPRNSYYGYNKQGELLYWCQLWQVNQLKLQKMILFESQMSNIINCKRFLHYKLPFMIYLSIVLAHNKIEIPFRKEIVENKIPQNFLYIFTISIAKQSFEAICLPDNTQNLEYVSQNLCSSNINKTSTVPVYWLLSQTIAVLSIDLLLHQQKTIQDEIFIVYNSLILLANRFLCYIKLLHGEQFAIKALETSIQDFNSTVNQPKFLQLQMIVETTKILFTKTCLQCSLMNKIGQIAEGTIQRLYLPSKIYFNILRETQQFLYYLFKTELLEPQNAIANYFQAYGIYDENYIKQSLEDNLMDEDQALKIKTDGIIHLILCMFYNHVYESPQEQLEHQILHYIINNDNLSKDIIHNAFRASNQYNYQVIEKMIDKLTIQEKQVENNHEIYVSFIPQQKLKISEQGIQQINIFDLDYYNQNILYFIQQNCTKEQLNQFVLKHLQIQDKILDLAKQVLVDMIQEKNIKYISSTDLFVLLCYIYALSKVNFNQKYQTIYSEILEQLNQNYDNLINKYPEAIKIILNIILKKEEQQIEEKKKETSILKSKLMNLKKKVGEQQLCNTDIITEQQMNVRYDHNDLLQYLDKNIQLCQICQLQVEEERLGYLAYIQQDFFTQDLNIRVFSCQHIIHDNCQQDLIKIRNISRCQTCTQEYNIFIPLNSNGQEKQIIKRILFILYDIEYEDISLEHCIQIINCIVKGCINHKNQNIQVSSKLIQITKSYILQNFNQDTYNQYFEASNFLKYILDDYQVLYSKNIILSQILNYQLLQDYDKTQDKILQQYNDIETIMKDNQFLCDNMQQLIEQIIITQCHQYQNNEQLLLPYQREFLNINDPQPDIQQIERYNFAQNVIQLFKQLEKDKTIGNDAICLYCHKTLKANKISLKSHCNNCNHDYQIFYLPYRFCILFYNIKRGKIYLQNAPYTTFEGYTDMSNLYLKNIYFNQKLCDDLYNFIISQKFNQITEDNLVDDTVVFRKLFNI